MFKRKFQDWQKKVRIELKKFRKKSQINIERDNVPISKNYDVIILHTSLARYI